MEAERVERKIQLTEVPLASLKNHPKNARKGNVADIKKSLLSHGCYLPLVIQKSTNYVLKGNHTLIALRELGVAEVSVNILDVDDIEALALLLDDNRSSDSSTYNLEELTDSLAYLSNLGELSRTLYDEADLEELINQTLGGSEPEAQAEAEKPDTKYTRKIEAPLYEPSEKKPEVSELYSRAKADELEQRIKELDLPFEIRKFLLEATSRHIVFNYSKIADFYAHSDPEVQRLMEDSALVIIDFNQALELGYVKLTQEIASLYQEDYSDAS